MCRRRSFATRITSVTGKINSAKTAGGAVVPIKVEGGSVYVGPAKVVKTDIGATNGVIHVIDTVLIPPAK